MVRSIGLAPNSAGFTDPNAKLLTLPPVKMVGRLGFTPKLFPSSWMAPLNVGLSTYKIGGHMARHTI
jgi:hypothetical protein